jgi:hypothetical protein
VRAGNRAIAEFQLLGKLTSGAKGGRLFGMPWLIPTRGQVDRSAATVI